MWAARDKDGFLALYDKKPKRVGEVWMMNNPRGKYVVLPQNWCTDVKWSDEGPKEVELVYKNALVVKSTS